MEPISGTTSAAATTGLLSLLIMAFGPVGAEVCMVILAAFAGSIVALTSTKRDGFWDTAWFIIVGIVVSLVLSWALTSLVIGWVPSLAGPYTTSIIAFCLGFGSDKLSPILDIIFKRINNKLKDTK